VTIPTFESGEDPFIHAFLDAQDGCETSGWPCPECGHPDARVLHLEPPYGALVECRGCQDQHPITF